MADTQTFAGLPIRDFSAATRWYSGFFGREPDETVDDEAMWQIAPNVWLFLTPDAERAGGGVHTLGVDDLEPYLQRWSAAGLSHEPVQHYSSGVRHVTILDPDGNSISLAEAPSERANQ